jgi:hypothetical protein
MPYGSGQKLGVSGVLMLAAMAAFALFIAFVAVPWISQSSGTHETTVTYIVGGICFLVAVLATLWARALNKKALNKKALNKKAAGGQ